MLIDMNMTIAYKCPICGAFEFFNISFFKLAKRKEYSYPCRCGRASLSLERLSLSRYKIELPCIGCGNEHTFILDRRDTLLRGISAFSCPRTGIQQCFIGADLQVREKIDAVEKELDELIDAFGYDNYFKNTRVMLDTLNKVHDIAEKGNLYCECGNSDLQVVLLSDSIQLLCKKCSGSKLIHAASNQDLKNTLQKQHITLLMNEPGGALSGSDTL